MKWVDLHIHTTFSDGTLSPTQSLLRAKEHGIVVAAIADHDSIDGIDEALKAGKNLGIKVIPAVEVSASINRQSIHILGYNINYHDSAINDLLCEIRKSRIERAKKIIEKLNEHGVKIKFEDVLKYAKPHVLGRPHIAETLVELGVVKERLEAFKLYLGEDRPCFVPKIVPEPKDIVRAIKDAGGIPVLAHPCKLDNKNLIYEVINAKVQGLEVWHPFHDDKDVEFLKGLCKKYNLLMTGGSDSHGDVPKYPQIGKFKVRYEDVEEFLKFAGYEVED